VKNYSEEFLWPSVPHWTDSLSLCIVPMWTRLAFASSEHLDNRLDLERTVETWFDVQLQCPFGDKLCKRVFLVRQCHWFQMSDCPLDTAYHHCVR